MATKIDYYELLEITRSASTEEVKKAYRQAALKYHPDRNPGNKEAEERFKLATEAYEVLSDIQKRQIYDQYGHAGLDSSGYQPFRGGVEDIFDSFGDLFEDIFGFGGVGGRRSRSGRARSHRGEDLQYNLAITFLESYQGVEKEIEFIKETLCEECQGRGYPASSQPTICPQCQGQGQLYHSQGFFTISSTCSACRGEGKIVKVLCGNCKGAGRTKKPKKLKVKVPAGIDQGNRLVLRGEGASGMDGGAPGDLYVVIHIEPDPLFHREGLDVWVDLPLSFSQAALGTVLTVPALEGEEEIEIPEGIEAGDTVVVKGKGFPELKGSHRGRLVYRVVLKTPKNLSERQKELLKEFASLGPEPMPEPSKKTNPKAKKKKKGWFGML